MQEVKEGELVIVVPSGERIPDPVFGDEPTVHVVISVHDKWQATTARMNRHGKWVMTGTWNFSELHSASKYPRSLLHFASKIKSLVNSSE